MFKTILKDICIIKNLIKEKKWEALFIGASPVLMGLALAGIGIYVALHP